MNISNCVRYHIPILVGYGDTKASDSQIKGLSECTELTTRRVKIEISGSSGFYRPLSTATGWIFLDLQLRGLASTWGLWLPSSLGDGWEEKVTDCPNYARRRGRV